MPKKTPSTILPKADILMSHKLRLFLWQAHRCMAVQFIVPSSFNWRKLGTDLGHTEEDSLQIVADLYRMGYISFSDQYLDHMVFTKMGEEYHEGKVS